jgi:outer membrane protein
MTGSRAAGRFARRPSRRAGLRRSRRAGLAALVAAALVAPGCSSAPFSTAMNPYAAAPPAPAAPWRAADGRKQPRLSSLVEQLSSEVQIDPDKNYGLVDLIDLAQRMNPETRRAWQDARAAAARLGQAESAWFPALAAAAQAGPSRVVERAGTNVGAVPVTGVGATPSLQLSWILFDFGRRSATVESAGWQVLSANLSFNRKHQEIAYAVARNFFSLDASRARVTAANASLDQARAVADAVQARLDQGLATRPELLLAVQERARAAFELREAQGLVDDARAVLAESIGISPTMPLRVADLASMPLPDDLPVAVEHVIDRSLGRRPDLAARLADLRSRDAEIKKARAQFMPRVSVQGSVGGDMGRYTFGSSDPINYAHQTYGAFLSLDWTLFDGFERENRVREATSIRGATEADVAALELRVIRQVWQAYTDVRTALGKREYAVALLAAAEEAYASTLESYRSAGLATVLDLLAAQRDLARARYTDIQSRADILQSSSALVFAAGD